MFLVGTEGSLLLFLERVDCLVKKSLKSSVFPLKSMEHLLLRGRDGTQDIFLLFRKVSLFDSLSDRRE